MDRNDGDGIRGVPRSLDVLELFAWIVGVSMLIGAAISHYQRDWGHLVGPAATTIAMLCVIMSRRTARRHTR